MSWDGNSEGVKETRAFFRHVRVPEQCSGEMLVAELQRVFCFRDLDDAFIQNTGSKLLKELRKANDEESVWLSHFLDHVARYPVQTKQATKHDIPYVIPLIPSIAFFSTPRRVTKRNADDDHTTDKSWKPGLYIKEVLSYCMPEGQIDRYFEDLQKALIVSPESDERFACLLDEKIRKALQDHVQINFAERSLGIGEVEHKVCIMPQSIRDKIVNAPFKRLAGDIAAVLSVKSKVSRRQFVAMLESVVRIGSAAHVLWTCNVYRKLELKMSEILKGTNPTLTESEVYSILNMPAAGLFSYGSNFQVKLREFFKDYELSSQRLNCLVDKLKSDAGFTSEQLDWSSVESLLKSVECIRAYAASHPEFVETYERDFSEHYRLAIKKYSLSMDSQSTHLQRFVLTTLAQNIQFKEVRFSRYDQSYFARRRTNSSRSALLVNAGAVALMTLVHCCSYRNGVVLLSNLLDAMQTYGITVPAGETAKRFKQQLRELGLTIDSPDAESGMVLQDIVANSESEG